MICIQQSMLLMEVTFYKKLFERNIRHLKRYVIDIIVEVAVEFAREGWVVVVVGQDTDILVLLCHYMDDLCGPLIFESKTKKWDIRKLKQNIGSENNKEMLSWVVTLSRRFMSQKAKF